MIVAGEPGHADNECFPAPLRFALDANGELTDQIAHPIAADIREGKDGRQLGKLKLVAGLTGLRLDDVVQRETQRRTRRLVVVASRLGGLGWSSPEASRSMPTSNASRPIGSG